MNTIIEICPYCKSEYYKKTPTQSTCSNKECRRLWSEAIKKHKWIITNHKMILKSKESSKKLITESKKTNIKEFAITDWIKKAILNEQKDNTWYTYCMECWEPTKPKYLDLHHIIFRSEIHWNHPQKHSKINSLLLWNSNACNCHLWKFHKVKSTRDKWIRNRLLWEVFPTVIKKEHYITEK